MKLNLSLMKLIIRLLVLMILFVMLFLISAFLYSARYWPDVYNYMKANITIKRIPTISELNLTIIEVVEYNTEGYSTTDIDYSTNELDANTEEYTFTFEDSRFPKSKVKRNAVLEDMGNDFSEVPKKGVLVDFFFVDEDGTMTKLMTDSVDERKLTTRNSEDVEVMKVTKFFGSYPKMTTKSCHGVKMSVSSAVFPWIATIFLKNESNGDQFDYFCDGALMSEKVVLTAARCVYNNTLVINPENFLIILGKTSLQVSSGGEKILKVAAVKPHENFTITADNAANDLAMLVLEEPVALNDAIATACLQNEDNIDDENDTKEAFTTAWSLPGDLTLVYFDKEKSKACGSDNKVENTFCATYGNDVALCPSYGGLYVTILADHLFLQGLRTGNPQDKGICYDKNVDYTSLKNHYKWIQDIIEADK